jgi:hypothetical protein
MRKRYGVALELDNTNVSEPIQIPNYIVSNKPQH